MNGKPTPVVAGIAYSVSKTSNDHEAIDLVASFNSRILCCYKHTDKILKFNPAENWTGVKISTKLNEPFILCVANHDHIMGIRVSIVKYNNEYHLTEEQAWKVILDKENRVRGGVKDIKIITGLKSFICNFRNHFDFNFNSKAII